MKIKPIVAAFAAVGFVAAAYTGIANAQPFNNILAETVTGRQLAPAQPAIASPEPVIAQAPQQSAEPEAAEAPQNPEVKVTVQPGDSLAKIAAAHQTTYSRLFDANPQVAQPDLIHPGQELRIPPADEQLTSRALPEPAAPAAAAAPTAVRTAYQAEPSATAAVDNGVWDRLAQCESSGNWSINTGNGYYGGLQFSLSSWQAVGGSGYPHQASKAEQIARAEQLLARQGWGAWPACTAKLGIR